MMMMTILTIIINVIIVIILTNVMWLGIGYRKKEKLSLIRLSSNSWFHLLFTISHSFLSFLFILLHPCVIHVVRACKTTCTYARERTHTHTLMTVFSQVVEKIIFELAQLIVCVLWLGMHVYELLMTQSTRGSMLRTLHTEHARARERESFHSIMPCVVFTLYAECIHRIHSSLTSVWRISCVRYTHTHTHREFFIKNNLQKWPNILINEYQRTHTHAFIV